MNILKEMFGLVLYMQCVSFGEGDVGFTGPWSSLFGCKAYLCIAVQVHKVNL